MKILQILLIAFFTISLSASQRYYTNYKADKIPKNMSVTTKKKRYFSLLTPAVQNIHQELMDRYTQIKYDMKHKRNRATIESLKLHYKVKTDLELLYALKPHPQSITLAQGAMESAWATSRFFTKANNVFGMWSSNKNEPRIAAGIKRKGNRTIWLRKFNSIEDSIRAYYELMAKGKTFKKFRKARYETDDVYKIIKKLDKYSEIGHTYTKELAQMIRYNKLTKYDK